MPKSLEQFLLIALYTLTTSSALILVKLGTKSGAPLQIVDGRLLFNLTPALFVGIALYAIGFVVFTYLVSKYDLGYVLPITTAVVYTTVFTVSLFVFNEVFTVAKVMGIILILIGVFLLNVSSAGAAK
jgi:drug/metabolite transporter (DMT)-like permease